MNKTLTRFSAWGRYSRVRTFSPYSLAMTDRHLRTIVPRPFGWRIPVKQRYKFSRSGFAMYLVAKIGPSRRTNQQMQSAAICDMWVLMVSVSGLAENELSVAGVCSSSSLSLGSFVRMSSTEIPSVCKRLTGREVCRLIPLRLLKWGWPVIGGSELVISLLYDCADCRESVTDEPKLGAANQITERRLSEVRTSTSIVPLKTCYEIHYPTLSNLLFYTNIYKVLTLPQAQGFRLVTPDLFLVRGLGLATRLIRY